MAQLQQAPMTTGVAWQLVAEQLGVCNCHPARRGVDGAGDLVSGLVTGALWTSAGPTGGLA